MNTFTARHQWHVGLNLYIIFDNVINKYRLNAMKMLSHRAVQEESEEWKLQNVSHLAVMETYKTLVSQSEKKTFLSAHD